VCYFVSIGAKAPGRLLAEAFDEQAGLDVVALPVCAPVAKAFPADDEVCLVTWRGCSCDLLGPGKRPASAVDSGATRLATAFKSAVVRVATQLGSVRLLVHRHREPSDLLLPRGPQLTLATHELMTREAWFTEERVMEIHR
jgi:hypothetical protein